MNRFATGLGLYVVASTILLGCVHANLQKTCPADKPAACCGGTNGPALNRDLAGAAASATLTGLVVLMKFKEHEGMQLPSRDFVSDALNMQISDFYGHATDWKVQPMAFIVTEYFTPAKGINAYDWWTSDTWENLNMLLREVSTGIANGSIKVKSNTGALEPVNLAACSRYADGKVMSFGTTYFVDNAGSNGVRAAAVAFSGMDDVWPQALEVSNTIARKFGCLLGSYTYGFVVGTYGRYDDPEKIDVGAQIHEIGHAFLEWPDIAEHCYGYGDDWEIIKRISVINKTGRSAVIRDCSGVPNGSIISVSVGDWDVWGVRNKENTNEFIVFENVCAKGYTLQFCKEHPGLNLLFYRVNTNDQTQVNVDDIATAKWEDGRPVGFSISNISKPGDVMSFKIRNSTPGTPRNCGTASGIQGYAVELYDQPGCKGKVGAFGASKYYAYWMPRMGIEPATASSIRILPGYKVALFEGRRLQGCTCVLSNSTDRLVSVDLKAHGFDKKTASLLVEAITPAPRY